MAGPEAIRTHPAVPALTVSAFLGPAFSGPPLISRRSVWTPAPAPACDRAASRRSTLSTVTPRRRLRVLRAIMAPGPDVAGNGSVNLDAAPQVGNGAALGSDGAVASDAPAVTPAAPAGALTLSGAELLRNGSRSQGLRYTVAQRKALRLTGLLPPTVETLSTQVERVMQRLGNLRTGLHEYEFLCSIERTSVSSTRQW